MRTTQTDIKQKREFDSPQQEAIVALLLTTDRVKGRLSRLATRFDITPQQYNVLRILNGAGEEGLPTLEIMNRMIERSPGITRLLDRIAAKKLIRRERLMDDRRCQICTITSKGRTLLEQMEEPMQQLSSEVMSELDEQQVQTLITLLSGVREGTDR